MNREQHVERILFANFLLMPGFAADRTIPTVGPFDQKALDRREVLANTITEDARQALARLSDDDFRIGFSTSHFARSEMAKALVESFKSKARELGQLPWYGRGLGHLDHQADYRRWSAMAHLNLSEAVCLTLGVEPSNFSEDELRALSKDFAAKPPPFGAIGHFIGWRFEVVRRRFDPQDAGDVAISTSELTAWIESVDLEIPDGFRRVFMKRFASKAEGAALQVLKIDRRELNSIAKLLTAIATDHYGYDPSSQRGRASPKLKDLSDRLGLELSEDTILKILRIGASFLPK